LDSIQNGKLNKANFMAKSTEAVVEVFDKVRGFEIKDISLYCRWDPPPLSLSLSVNVRLGITKIESKAHIARIM
jgi:hypothetical protein